MKSQYACIVFFQLDKCTQGLLITVITKVISFKRRPQPPCKWMLTLAEQHHFLPSQHNQFCYTKQNQKILSGRLSQKVCSVEVFNNTILKKKIKLRSQFQKGREIIERHNYICQNRCIQEACNPSIMANSNNPIRNISGLNQKTSKPPKVNRILDSAINLLRKATGEGEVVVGTEYVMRQEAVQVYSIHLSFCWAYYRYF